MIKKIYVEELTQWVQFIDLQPDILFDYVVFKSFYNDERSYSCIPSYLSEYYECPKYDPFFLNFDY